MFCFWVTLSSGYLALYILMPSMLNHSSHVGILRSEEHTSELQSQSNIVCRLLLEKKNEDESTATPAPRYPRDATFSAAHLASLLGLAFNLAKQLPTVVIYIMLDGVLQSFMATQLH